MNGSSDTVATVGIVLVLSAWEPEIAPLRRRLARPPARALAHTIVCRPAGVGAVDAAIGAARAIAEVKPVQIIFVGTAGSYPGRRTAPAIGGVALPDELVLCSTAALRGDGYLPAPVVQRVPAAPALLAGLRGASPSIGGGGAAVSPLAITRSATLARRIARATGAAYENLETFSVARAAALAGLPFAAVLGIANRVGPTAHAEWRRHHQAASKAACAVVWDWLRSDA
jgi:nucleoside phosphorylase